MQFNMRNVKNVIYWMLESNIKLSIAVAAGRNLAIFYILFVFLTKLQKADLFNLQLAWFMFSHLDWFISWLGVLCNFPAKWSQGGSRKEILRKQHESGIEKLSSGTNCLRLSWSIWFSTKYKNISRFPKWNFTSHTFEFI